MKRQYQWALSVFLLLLCGQPALADNQGISPKAATAVDRTVQDFMKAHRLAGVGVAILSHSRIAYVQGYGEVNRYQPVDLASVSKCLTAILALRLQEKGKLDLDAPVSRYLTELDLPSQVTARSLLTHTSGLPHYGDSFSGRGFNLSAFRESALSEKAGSFVYSSPGYVLLSHVLEKAGGETFLKLLHKEVCAPSSVSPRDVRLSKEAGWRSGAGGVEASPEALARISYALLQGRLLNRQNRALAWTSQVNVPGKAGGQGLGFRVEDDGSKIWHNGSHSKLGKYSRLVLYPRKGHGMFIYLNGPSKVSPGKLSTALYKALKGAGHKL